MVKRNRYEDILQKTMVLYLKRINLKKCKWFHINNGEHSGGRNGAIQGARAKMLGQIPGVSDLVFICGNLKKSSTLWVEVKLAKTAFHKKTYQNKDQKAFEKDITRFKNNFYHVVRTLDELIDIIKQYKIT